MPNGEEERITPEQRIELPFPPTPEEQKLLETLEHDIKSLERFIELYGSHMESLEIEEHTAYDIPVLGWGLRAIKGYTTRTGKTYRKYEELRYQATMEWEEKLSDYDALMKKLLTRKPEDMPSYNELIGEEAAPEAISIAEQLAAELAEIPRPKPIGMHLLTTEQILENLRTRRLPELPEGLVEEDVYGILRGLGYEEEGVQEAVDYIEGVVKDPIEAYEELHAMIEQAKAEGAKMKPVSWKTHLKTAAVQPFLYLAKAVEPYFNYVSRPFAGHLMRTVAKFMPGEQAIEEAYKEARETENWWMAAGEAFENLEGNWAVKLATEIIADPLTYVGFGIFTRATKGIPLLGPAVGSAEKGFIRAVDAPFHWFKAQWSKGPKTVPQLARAHAQNTTTKAMAYPAYATGKSLRQISLEETQAKLIEAVDIHRAFPANPGEAGAIGRLLLESHTDYITETELITWARKAGVKLESVTDQTLSDVQFVLDTTYGYAGGAILPHDVAAIRMIASLGAHDTPENVAKVTELIASKAEAVATATKEFIRKPDSAKRLFGEIYNKVYQSTEAKAVSRIALQRERIGLTTAMLRRYERSTLNSWRLAFDRQLVMPFAKAYLMFANYGLPNVFESWFKGGFGRAGWKVRVGDSQVDHFKDIWGHLPNAPYDIVSFQPRKGWTAIKTMPSGEARLELLATTAGRDAFISKVIAPNWLSRFLIEPFGELSMQRYSYVLRNWMKQNMFDETPEIAGGIQKIVKDIPLPPGLPKHIADKIEIKEAVFEYALAGNLRELPRRLTVNRIARGDLAKEFEPFVGITQQYKEHILRLADSGELWENIDTAFEYVTRTMHEEYLRSPEYVAIKYKEIANAMADEGIQDYTGFMRAVQLIDDYTGVFDDVTWHFRNIARQEGHNIVNPIERQAFHDDMMERLMQYHTEASDALDRMVEMARANIDKAGLSKVDTNRALKLLEANKSKYNRLKDIRAEEFALTRAKFASVAPKARTDVFWADLYRTQEIPWEKAKPFMVEDDTIIQTLRDKIGKVKYPDPIDTSGRSITPGDIAKLWDTTPNNLSQGLFDYTFGVIMPKEIFVRNTLLRAQRAGLAKGVKAEQLGYTAERIGEVYDNVLISMRIDPVDVASLTPKLAELESMRQLTHQVHRTKSIPEATLRETRAYVNRIADEVDAIPRYLKEVPAPPLPRIPKLSKKAEAELDRIAAKAARGEALTPEEGLKAAAEAKRVAEIVEGVPPPVAPVARELSDSYRQAQINAMNKARKDYAITFSDYDPAGQMVVDDVARSIFPYWPYEIHRPFWIARNFMRYPVMPLSLSRFNNYTDRGYVHIPGTSVEFNPFRGTIFGPVLTRLTMRDFPEYYDTFPGLSQSMDIMGRFGFYPGIHFQLPMTMFGARGTVKPQMGMLLPSWIRTPLNTALGVLPSDATEVLRDIMFPDYFRDYMTILAVNRRGGEGVLIYDKKLAGKPLTDEEESIWEAAAKEIARHGIYFEQIAVFRYRPEEMNEAWEAASQIIEERMGITKEQQDYCRKRGLRLSDYFFPFDPETQRILNDLEALKNWSGMTVPLQPTKVQEELARRTLFWDSVEHIMIEYEETQADYDARFLAGEIKRDTWRARTSGLLGNRQEAIDQLKKREYPDVPTTLEEILAYYEEKGSAPPTLHPERELMYLYYGLEVEEVWDDDSETWVMDWNKYYAQVDTLIAALPEELRTQFIKDITNSMSPLRRLQWDINRDYVRPYRNTFYLALVLYSSEEQQAIRDWYRIDRKEERERLEEIVAASGNKLISEFRTKLRIMRQNLRMIDPDLDAWLYFFGHTDTFKTPIAEELYYALCRQYNKVP